MAHRSQHRIRVVDGVEQYQCTDIRCLEWKPRSDFTPRTTGKLGITSRCRECMRRCTREYRERNRFVVNEKARLHAAEKRREQKRGKRAADRTYRQVLLEGGSSRSFVPADIVRPWVEHLMLVHGDQHAVERATGVQVRRLYGIISGAARFVEMTTADLLAMAADKQAALAAEVPVVGTEGWSRAGHVCCEGCGTCWHPHRARGLCAQCYYREHTADLYPVQRLPRDQRAWSNHWLACRCCKGTERAHKSRGLCTTCYAQLHRAGDLERFPPLMPGKSFARRQKARHPAPVGGTGAGQRAYGSRSVQVGPSGVNP